MDMHNRLIVAGILVVSIFVVLRAEDSLPDSAGNAGVSLSTTADSARRVIIVKENRDTVFTLDASTPAACVHDARHALETSRARGFGIGGGPVTGMQAIAMAPVEALIAQVDPLAGREFGLNRFGYEPFWMRGGIGFAGMGNGLRIGGAGASGSRRFKSEHRSGESTSVILDVQVGYGGFLLEKAMTVNRLNVVVGGMIGGGTTETAVQSIDTGSYSIFNIDRDERDSDKIKARFAMAEVHGGLVWTMCPVFHIGIDVVAPFFFSANGFEPYTADFYSVNPGIRLKFVFGNLG
jgi:hypothetical protein